MRQGLVEFNAAFVIQIINALVLFGALTYILFKPVTKFMKKRTEGIESNIDEAEARVREANELKAEYEEQLKDIRNERVAIIRKATEMAETESNRIITEAKENAEEILEKARAQIEVDRQRMTEELMAEVSSLAITVASKVIEKDLDEAAHKNMIQHFIDEVGDVRWEN
ncbi:MAG TPA: F0F1 ATP synthase subunit B [Clostridia bacterium]|nr:F0F1 ATP synthase subunit B [Clostridia bacterium]